MNDWLRELAAQLGLRGRRDLDGFAACVPRLAEAVREQEGEKAEIRHLCRPLPGGAVFCEEQAK